MSAEPITVLLRLAHQNVPIPGLPSLYSTAADELDARSPRACCSCSRRIRAPHGRRSHERQAPPINRGDAIPMP